MQACDVARAGYSADSKVKAGGGAPDVLGNIRRTDQTGIGKIILKRYNHITYEAGNMADLYECGHGPLSETAG
jgi:hypothetical protein